MNEKDLQNVIRGFLSKDGNSPITEANLTKVQLDKREEYIKQLKKNKVELVKRYGKDAESVMYGRATNLAKKAVSTMNKQKLKELVKTSLMKNEVEENKVYNPGELDFSSFITPEQKLVAKAFMVDPTRTKMDYENNTVIFPDPIRIELLKGGETMLGSVKMGNRLGFVKGYFDEDGNEIEGGSIKIPSKFPMGEGKKPFPDLTGDGKVTKADILKGRGVELKEVVIASDMTTEEASGHAERFAKYMSDKEGRDFSVTIGSVDGPSFDLDLDGEPYEGGSYIISTAGEILNMALPEHPVYANITMLEDKNEKPFTPPSDPIMNRIRAAMKRDVKKAPVKEAGMFVTEVYVPSNIEEFAKRKGVMSLVKKVASWAEKAGKGIRGGTAIGKDYSTLVLDLTYGQNGEIRINLDNDTVTLYNKPVTDAKSFKQVYLDNQEAKGEVKEETYSVGPMIKSKEFKAGDKVKYKGMNHEITRIVDDRIYIKNLKYSGRPDTWVKAIDLKKSVSEDIDLGHEDNEPHMIKGDLYRIGKYAMELYAMVEELEETGQEIDFPAWWQAMITDSKEQMVKAKHYLDFELKEPAIDAMVDAATGEAPHMGEPMMEDKGDKHVVMKGNKYYTGTEFVSDIKNAMRYDIDSATMVAKREKGMVYTPKKMNENSAEETLVEKIAKALKAPMMNEDEIGKADILSGELYKLKGKIQDAFFDKIRKFINMGSYEDAEYLLNRVKGQMKEKSLAETIAKKLKSK